MGMLLTPILSMFSTLQSIKYIIRTAFGDSDSSIDEVSLPKAFQEILQGNGSSLISWVVTSIPMVATLKVQGCGTMITSTISKESFFDH